MNDFVSFQAAVNIYIRASEDEGGSHKADTRESTALELLGKINAELLVELDMDRGDLACIFSTLTKVDLVNATKVNTWKDVGDIKVLSSPNEKLEQLYEGLRNAEDKPAKKLYAGLVKVFLQVLESNLRGLMTLHSAHTPTPDKSGKKEESDSEAEAPVPSPEENDDTEGDLPEEAPPGYPSTNDLTKTPNTETQTEKREYHV